MFIYPLKDHFTESLLQFRFISGHLGWKDVFLNIKEFLVSFQGISVIQIRECLSSPFCGSCTFCFFTQPAENRATKRIETASRLPFVTLPLLPFFSTTWRFVTTLHQASPSEPFPQQYLLVSCLCHILVISRIFLIILFAMVIFLNIFFMWTILKIFIEFVTTLLLLCVLVFGPQGM